MMASPERLSGKDEKHLAVAVLLPVGRDAELVSARLRAEGIVARPCGSPQELLEVVRAGCGAVVVGQEALQAEDEQELADALAAQPPWSDLPVVVLLLREPAGEKGMRQLARRRATTVLRRPMETAMLLSVVRGALEARRRQLVVRDLLDELDLRNRQLGDLALELTRAEEAERARIAAVLHDDLQQTLAYAKLRTQAMRQKTAATPTLSEAAEDVQAAVSDAIAQSRSLSHELAPPLLHTQGLGAALEWLAGSMKEKYGLRVETDIERSAPPPRTDVATFAYQAARELLFNVTKHAGTDRAALRMRIPDGAVELVVEDAGRGFDPTELRSRGGTGAGFGLFSIEHRASLLGGSLRVESTEGQGSRIILTLPAAGVGRAEAVPAADRPGASRPEATAGEGQAEPKSLTVLLVDDHTVMREGLARLLAGSDGIEVIGEAADGEQAVARARELTPDVVLIDVSMPGMSGVEATRLIKAERPDVRVVGLSMHAMDGTRESMLQAGADDYVTKDAPPEELLAAVIHGGSDGR